MDSVENVSSLCISSYDQTPANTKGAISVYSDGQNVSRRRHDGKTNFCFADGHVETISEVDYTYHKNLPKASGKLLWAGN